MFTCFKWYARKGKGKYYTFQFTLTGHFNFDLFIYSFFEKVQTQADFQSLLKKDLYDDQIIWPEGIFSLNTGEKCKELLKESCLQK